MIEICDIFRFKIYRLYSGPFCLFFFNQYDGEVKDIENIALIKSIQLLEVEYKDIPLLAFEYNTFMKIHPNLIKSCLDILIIQKGENNILFEKPEKDNLKIIFDKVRQTRLNRLKIENKEFKKNPYKISMRIWIPNNKKRTIDHIIKCNEERFHQQNLLMGIKTDIHEKYLHNIIISSNQPESGKCLKTNWRKPRTRYLKVKPKIYYSSNIINNYIDLNSTTKNFKFIDKNELYNSNFNQDSHIYHQSNIFDNFSAMKTLTNETKYIKPIFSNYDQFKYNFHNQNIHSKNIDDFNKNRHHNKIKYEQKFFNQDIINYQKLYYNYRPKYFSTNNEREMLLELNNNQNNISQFNNREYTQLSLESEISELNLHKSNEIYQYYPLYRNNSNPGYKFIEKVF